MPSERKNKISCQHFLHEMEVALEAISGKWKSAIIWNLYLEENIRFNGFLKIIPEITQKMLTQQLRNLESSNLIRRKIYPVVPPVVDYSLTPLGKELIPILEDMNRWGKKFISMYEEKE